MFSDVHSFKPSTSVNQILCCLLVFLLLSSTLRIIYYCLILNLLKPYIALCIEINSSIFMDLIMFSVFLFNNEWSKLMYYAG